MELISHGAEAKLLKVNKNTLRKIREAKTYRINEIDYKLRKFRTRREFKVLGKLYDNNVLVPKPIELNDKEFYFDLEFIEGSVLKNIVNEKLLSNAFSEIIKMHSLDIIHGDLTTLNFIVKKDKAYIIDFGLSEFTNKIEDKAVDLNLFFTCIKNEHPNLISEKNKLLKKYSSKVERGVDILKRLEQIEHRGRNK